MTKSLYGVQKEHLRLNKKQFVGIRTLFHLSKNMYNLGLYNIRQHFFENKTYLNYEENYKQAKHNENYKLLGSACAQQTLKKVDEAFSSFFATLKTEKKAKIPKYLEKEGFFELSYPQFKLQHDGTYNLPMSPAFKKQYGKINIPFPKNLDPTKVCEIRLIPKYNARYIEVEYVYKIEIKKQELDDTKALALDLGLNNFVTAVTTDGTSFILDGKKLKSINHWYNKQNAKYQSLKDKQGYTHFTKRQIKLTTKRNNQVRDYLNKAVRYLIDFCLDHQVGNIIAGHNPQWKNEINLGKKNNQQFVQIPHSLFLKKLESMCERYNIRFKKQEESYTSKASFLDQDELPVYEEGKTYTFSGKRIKRGLYQTKNGILLNADVNGAANILMKSNHKFLWEEVAKGILTFPTRIQLDKAYNPFRLGVSSKNHVTSVM